MAETDADEGNGRKKTLAVAVNQLAQQKAEEDVIPRQRPRKYSTKRLASVMPPRWQRRASTLHWS